MAENKSNNVRVNLTDTEKKKVTEVAEKRGMSVSSFVRWVLVEYLKEIDILN